MRLRRANVRYGRTPEPSTPYQAAQQTWDEAIGSSRVQAANWRYLAFGLLAIVVLVTAGLLWQMTRSVITPYIVEVDSHGAVQGVGPVGETYRPTEAQIAYHLSKFLHNVRSLPLDPIVLRDQWLEAYDYTSARGAQMLNEYARERNPFAEVGRVSVTTDITSVVRASHDSFQLRWIERTFIGGALNSTESWTGIFSILLHTPKDVARIRKNPLGIYVDGLDWSRELGTDNSAGDHK